MFSGDKLFGSVQSGIIAGNSEIVDSIKNFSIFRTYRCSAIVLSELQKTTEMYLKKSEKNIPFWSLLTEQYIDLEKRIKEITKNIKHNFEIITGVSIIGGGTLPNVTLKSPVLVLNISETDKILTELLGNEIPIIPRVANGKINLDLRSVFENQDSEITKFLNSI
jgi:L-seryl-tRNA(Ser) seleniumtransferase